MVALVNVIGLQLCQRNNRQSQYLEAKSFACNGDTCVAYIAAHFPCATEAPKCRQHEAKWHIQVENNNI
jgi:hypothetical protein